jgi:uncharacterized membrane protein
MMDFGWILYAILLFVAGGTCFLTALTALTKLDRGGAQGPSPALLAPGPPPEAGPRLTRLGRPVKQIQIL